MTPSLGEVPSQSQTLRVRTHVGRDILQSAQMFRTVESALWEYVVNSLQYTDPGVTPRVSIRIDSRAHRITISDNAQGMDTSGLQNFFTMHGVNQARRAGRAGRGKFGTGKSAAFGVGTGLKVETVRAGVRNVAVVTLDDIRHADEGEVPVARPVIDELVPEAPNGTVIVIEGVNRRMNKDAVRRTLSRYLSSFRHDDPRVSLDDVAIPVWAPEIRFTRTFTPPPALAPLLGEATLEVSVAATPLDEDERGIAVTVGAGNLVAREAAGVASKEFGNYLFGEVDCPALESEESEQVAAFGNNRDLRLNSEHPVAAALIGYIGFALEQVRAALVDEHRAARRGEEARRLKATADEIAEILNSDFAEHAERLEVTTVNARRRSPVPAYAGPEEANPDDPTYVLASVGEPGVRTGTAADAQDEADSVPDPDHKPGGDGTGKLGGDIAALSGTPNDDGPELIKPTGGAGNRRPRGGLQVEYEHHGDGDDAHRSQFDEARSRIVINLDHPAVKAAAAADGGVTGTAFKRLSYEIAFTEYALALARLEYIRNPEIDGSDVLFEVRDALRRVAVRSAALYGTA